MIGERLEEFVARLLRPQRTLRRRILVGNAVVAVLLLVAAGIVALQVRTLVSAVETLQEARRHVNAAIEVRHQTTDLMAVVTRLLPDEDAEAFSTDVAARLDTLKAAQGEMVAIAAEVEDTQTAAALETVNGEVTNVTNIADTMVRQARADQWHSVVIRVGLLNRDQQEVIDAVDGLLRSVRRLETTAASQVSSAVRAAIIYPAAVFVLIVIVGTALVLQVTNGITRPVERLTEGAARLERGDFDQRVDVEADDEIGQLARAFNNMADQLQLHYQRLEERVAERTRALETTLRISRRLSTILDQETLTQEVVDQIQQAFNYYHVHIYLYGLRRKHLLMVGGTGEAGRAMLLSGHRLEAGKGLVGRAAARNEVTLVPDVREDADWLANPLLPETRAELAVPIAYGDQVQGVLDVQHHVAGGLGSSDADLLQIIAAQVAVALQNAKLLAQVRTRAERAARINSISQRVQRAASVDQVLEIAVQELGRTLSVDTATIELRTPRVRADRIAGTQGNENGDH